MLMNSSKCASLKMRSISMPARLGSVAQLGIVILHYNKTLHQKEYGAVWFIRLYSEQSGLRLGLADWWRGPALCPVLVHFVSSPCCSFCNFKQTSVDLTLNTFVNGESIRTKLVRHVTGYIVYFAVYDARYFVFEREWREMKLNESGR